MCDFWSSSARPEGITIFCGGMDATAGPMLRQMQAPGIDAKFVSGDGVCSEKLPLEAGMTAFLPALTLYTYRKGQLTKLRVVR